MSWARCLPLALQRRGVSVRRQKLRRFQMAEHLRGPWWIERGPVIRLVPFRIARDSRFQMVRWPTAQRRV